MVALIALSALGLFPTGTELAWLEVSQKNKWPLLPPTLLGEVNTQKQHDYLYWKFSKEKKVFCKGSENLFIWEENKYELYDLNQDVGEENDLIEQYP